MNFVCRICNNAEKNIPHQFREMMFGTREQFDYVECARCGTIQIREIPDLSRHYPKNYYSLTSGEEPHYIEKHLRRRTAARLAGKYFMTGKGFLGKRLSEKKDWLRFYFPDSLREKLLGISSASRILDFGCGDGKLLKTLALYGFQNLTGADAFIEKDILYPNGVKIFKKNLSQLEPPFDLIMLHHSFEHLPNPLESLREIRRLLAKEKHALIRIPVVGFAWEKYGADWVQLDAPRHLFSYTEKGFRLLAEKAGFTVEKVVYDSEEFQFWASEYYARDIAMTDENWFKGDFSESLFSPEQFEEWRKQAKELNRQGRGDQAVFYLK